MEELLEQIQLTQVYRSIRNQLLRRVPIYFLLVLAGAILAAVFGLAAEQVWSVAVFSGIIFGALLFWSFRLAFALVGLATLLVAGLTDAKAIVAFAGLDIILFLIGMMILIGFLEERHFFDRLVEGITDYIGPHAVRLASVLMVLAAVFAAMVDEVTSILFMIATVFQIAGRYRVSPIPLLIMTVFATNIGSAATVVGNPVGVMLALRAGLTFIDFLRWATPIAILALVVAIPLLLWHFRRPLAELQAAMNSLATEPAERTGINQLFFDREMRLPWLLFGGTILSLVLHTPVEKLLDLEKNSMLLGTALGVAGLVLVLDRHRARELVERRVEWWSLTFFMLLFASVATLSSTGVTNVLAGRLAEVAEGNELALFFAFTWVGAIASSLMDNVLAIATLIPVVQELDSLGVEVFPLWWGMLFAGTFFGNLTMIGSTANIVAIGMLERRGMGHITMGEWMKATAIPSIVTLAMASGLLYLQLLR